MRVFLIVAATFCFVRAAFSQQSVEELLNQLDAAIENRDRYTAEKINRINVLKSRLPGTSLQEQYDLYSAVYDEYKSFTYDSAFLYARRLQDAAKKLR